MLKAGAIALVLAKSAMAAPNNYNYGYNGGYNNGYNQAAPTTVTSTTCLGTNGPAFTSTVGNTVIIGKTAVYNSITSACAADQMPYSTTIAVADCTTPGTIKYVTPMPYVTTERWCSNGYTSTISGTVSICHQQATNTVTFSVPANSAPYTSTIAAVGSVPGTVIYGTPSAYATTNMWCASDNTQTSGATVTVCHKQSTDYVTMTVPADQPAYTSTVAAVNDVHGTIIYGTPGPYSTVHGPTVTVCHKQQYKTVTQTIPAGQPAYTTTMPAVDSTPGTVICATPAPYATVTQYCAGGPTTMTSGATVTVCRKQSTRTVTTTVAADTPAYTSTVPAVDNTPGTVIYATPAPYTSIHKWCSDAGTTTRGATVTICHQQSTTTVTTTIGAGSAAYTSTIPAFKSIAGTVIVATPSAAPQPVVAQASATTPSGGTPPTTTPASCGNGGFEYAIYNNPFKGGSTRNDPYTIFDPAYFQQAQVVASGVTSKLGYTNTGYGNAGTSSSTYNADVSSSSAKNYGTLSLYGSTTSLNAQYFTVAHRAYLVAAEAGDYTFTMTNTDDFVGIWTGTFAIRDYSRANLKECQVYADHDNKGIKTYTVTLRQGQYIPFRIIYANGGGPANFQFSITTPSGKVVASGNDGDSAPYIVRSFCDGTNPFPAFKPWSAEIY